MKTPNDLRCELALRRLHSSIQRSGGQHSRAIAARFAAARALLGIRSNPSAICAHAAAGCNYPQGECLGVCFGGMA